MSHLKTIKMFTFKVGGLILLNLYLTNLHEVSAVTFEINTFLPNTLRKAKEGLDIIFHRAPPKVVIPHVTGIGKLDVFLFQSMQISSTVKGSFANQWNALTPKQFIVPNLCLAVLCSVPVDKLESIVSNFKSRSSKREDNWEVQKSLVTERIQHFQSILKAIMSCQVAQMVSVAFKDVIMQHVSKINPTVLYALESLSPKYIPLATAMFVAYGFMSRYESTVLSSESDKSTFTVKITPIENEVTATTMTIDVVENDAIVVTDVADNAQYTTIPVPGPSNKDDVSFEVNVTKISAVLDRFESKILSLVGGTRFHPSMVTSETEQHESAETLITNADDANNKPNTNEKLEAAKVIGEVVDDVDPIEPLAATVDPVACSEENSTEPASSLCTPSLTPYEMIPMSPVSSSLFLPSFSTSTAVRAIGVIVCSLFSTHVLPPVVRYTIAVIAGIVLLNMVVQQIPELFSRPTTADSFESLVQDIETRSQSYTKEMEALVVDSEQVNTKATSPIRSHMQFWATRLPILNGIAMFSNKIASSSNVTEIDHVLHTEVNEMEEYDPSSSQLEASIEYYKEPESEDLPKSTTKSNSVKSGWSLRRGKSSTTKSKIVRTACAAIIGM